MQGHRRGGLRLARRRRGALEQLIEALPLLVAQRRAQLAAMQREEVEELGGHAARVGQVARDDDERNTVDSVQEYDCTDHQTGTGPGTGSYYVLS